MRQYKVLLISLVLLLLAERNFAREITDMVGRTVTIPDKLERVIPYDSKTSILLFPFLGEKLTHKATTPGEKKHSFISNEYEVKPVIDVKNLEEVLIADPDIIIVGNFIPSDPIERSETLQKRTHVPVVIIDLSLDKLDKTYAFLGELLGDEAGSGKYVEYLSSLYAEISGLMSKKSLSGISAYYTLGANGMMTDPAGSRHTEVLDFLKIPNAAEIEIPSGGHATVNMEQIMMWNPDYILASDFKGESNPYDAITSNRMWAGIKAVEDGNVYKVPNEPFGWFDHPPTINRICGLIWLCEIFYDYPKEKSKEQMKSFYALFYKYDLSESDFEELYN